MKKFYKPTKGNDNNYYILECGMFICNSHYPDEKLVYNEILYRGFDNALLYFLNIEDAIIFCNAKNSLK